MRGEILRGVGGAQMPKLEPAFSLLLVHWLRLSVFLLCVNLLGRRMPASCDLAYRWTSLLGWRTSEEYERPPTFQRDSNSTLSKGFPSTVCKVVSRREFQNIWGLYTASPDSTMATTCKLQSRFPFKHKDGFEITTLEAINVTPQKIIARQATLKQRARILRRNSPG